MPQNQADWRTFQLDTPRLRLCGMGEADVESIYQLYQEPQVAEYLSRLPSPWSRDTAQAFVAAAQVGLAQGSAYTLSMVQRDTGMFAGVVTLRIPASDPANSDEERLEDAGLGILGYSVMLSCWNRGYATEGARRMVGFAFEDLGLERLQATPLRGNIASQRVLERLGFAIDEAGVWEEPLYGGPARLADCYMLYRG